MQGTWIVHSLLMINVKAMKDEDCLQSSWLNHLDDAQPLMGSAELGIDEDCYPSVSCQGSGMCTATIDSDGVPVMGVA